MKSYKNLAGNVGICSYELGEKKIRIKFHSRKSFIYDCSNNGEEHINEMQRLAIQGFGLTHYINDADLKAVPLD
ncbi:MAG: hypothetical protein L3J51_06820 [Cocleimonas sp.]|nr:hypothetical protein [Cocleimonas sp.]